MSMDEQYEQMQHFHRALSAFNESLRGSMVELEARHDNLSAHWQDEFRRYYDQAWEPFNEAMKHYLRLEGPRYSEFLALKLHALGRYLRGG